jgi:hypothetical protein
VSSALTGMGAEDDIDHLYELPLEEFTSARNALAKDLGGEEGKRVKALRKPSAAAWALNQAARRSPAILDEFLGAAEELRQAHEALLGGGDREAVDAATRRERAAAAALADEAQAAAGGGGAGLRDKVDLTLRAALSDDEVRAELEAGRLVREREAAGLGPFGAAVPAPAPGKKRGAAKAERDRATRAELKKAREREKEADRRARDAGQSVAAARERAEAAMETLERAQREEKEARAAADEAADEVRKLERSLS